MNEPKKKSQGKKWVFLYILMGIIDLAQIIVDFTGVGIAFSVAADPFIGAILLGIFQFAFRINMITKPARIASILAVMGLDFLTGGIAPFWIVDVWYVRRDVRKEEAEEEEKRRQNELLSNRNIIPLYNGETRPPKQGQNTPDNNKITPLNQGDVRPPRQRAA
jgi:uncharacterized membrane protein